MQNWIEPLIKALWAMHVPPRYQMAVARVAVTASRRTMGGR